MFSIVGEMSNGQIWYLGYELGSLPSRTGLLSNFHPFVQRSPFVVTLIGPVDVEKEFIAIALYQVLLGRRTDWRYFVKTIDRNEYKRPSPKADWILVLPEYHIDRSATR